MADRKLTVIARRDDGAYLVGVEGSGCVLTVIDDPDDPDSSGIWANDLDTVVGRGNWVEHEQDGGMSGMSGMPGPLAESVQAFVQREGWCPLDETGETGDSAGRP